MTSDCFNADNHFTVFAFILSQQLLIRFCVARFGPGNTFDYDRRCLQSHVSDYGAGSYKGFILSGCVAVWGKSIRNVSRLVVNHGLDFGAMPPLPDHHSASLESQLLVGLLRNTNRISYARWLCHTSTSDDLYSKTRARLHLFHVKLRLKEAAG